MKKQKSITLTRVMLCISTVLILTSLLLIFSNCITLRTRSTTGLKLSSAPTSHTGIQAVFGESKVLRFSFLNFLTYILAAACLVLILLKIFKNYKSPAYNYSILILTLIAAIFFFCESAFAVPVKQEALVKSVVLVKTLSAGAIASGALMLASAVTTIIAIAKDAPYYYTKNAKNSKKIKK